MNIISLGYHETLMAGSGRQAEEALAQTVRNYSRKYVCVVEGSIPTRDNGIYMKLAGRPATEVLADVGAKAGAIIAIGSCAAWGGIPSADPDPTVDVIPSEDATQWRVGKAPFPRVEAIALVDVGGVEPPLARALPEGHLAAIGVAGPLVEG